MLKKISLSTLLILVLVFTLSCVFYKPSIHEADYNDLIEVYGIGDELAYRIVHYLNEHPNYTIDDLIYVKGIGEVKLKALKGEFR